MTLVQIVLGSASDLDAVHGSGMQDALASMGITSSVSVCSAHRNIDELAKFVERTLASGTKLYVGVAGVAAALPGALAGLTGMKTPVIGVPMDEHGIDSCVHMPPGVPVLTAGVGKSGLKNATLGAAQILAAGDAKIAAGLADYLRRTAKAPQFDVPRPATPPKG
jgi:phosphoribosylaminoimidazole carboxylase PurE protein